jgi:hypothetical protein
VQAVGRQGVLKYPVARLREPWLLREYVPLGCVGLF